MVSTNSSFTITLSIHIVANEKGTAAIMQAGSSNVNRYI
jgi:hypothetical protein